MQLVTTNPVVAGAAQKPVGSLPSLSSRIPELDGLRGVAIAMVLVYHYFLIPFPITPATPLSYTLVLGRLSWTGVDLFFVLSGFLIGGILLDARDSSNYFRVFYTRRFFRIIPAYAVFVGAAFLLGYVAHSGFATRFAWIPPDQLPWAPHFLFLQNFWMAAKNTIGQLGITWSLAVEEQFYLTIPLLIRVLSPRRLQLFLFAGILAAPALRITLHALWPDHFVSWFVLMPCRADALLLGVFGAFAMRNPRWRSILEKYRGFMFSVLALLASGFVVLTLRYPDPYGFGMLAFGFTWLALFYLCLLLCALLYRDTWISRCLRWGWLGWLGIIAYGTYLFHELVLQLLWGFFLARRPLIWTLQDLLIAALALIVTILFCWLLWNHFEKPLLQWGHRSRYLPVETRTIQSAEAFSAAPGFSVFSVARNRKAKDRC